MTLAGSRACGTASCSRGSKRRRNRARRHFSRPETARLITPGNFEDNLAWCGEADWIIEAVAENLEIKRKLFERVEAVRKPGTIVTTNTSGLPIRLIAEGRSEDFQQHWAGTHFFNPPRYMKLVELIPGPKTRPDVLKSLEEICDRRLGKGVVVGERHAEFHRQSHRHVFDPERDPPDAGAGHDDRGSGRVHRTRRSGWPKSATFRTADIVGLDVLVHVIRNIYENAPDDESREMYRVPPLVEEMMKRGWLGEKTGSGFYKRVKKGGESEILTLDWQKMEYRPRQKAKFGSIEAGKAIEDTRERLRVLVAPALEGKGGDKANQLPWAALSEMCLYAARRVPEIADSIVDVDRAMRWGFGWELGPFEMWDAIGVERDGARRSSARESRCRRWSTKVLASPRKSFYESKKERRAISILAPARRSP